MASYYTRHFSACVRKGLASGNANPFVRVAVGSKVQRTESCEDEVSPCWDAAPFVFEAWLHGAGLYEVRSQSNLLVVCGPFEDDMGSHSMSPQEPGTH